jgi:hypothetical protein
MWKNSQPNYVLFFGIIPEFLLILEMIVMYGVNWIYYAFVDKTQRLLDNDTDKKLDASLHAII